ncbi:phosphoribosylanthranilate isomerase [Niabella beijingensis]|uniref:phosphoribosylanthranilate isomerase n=1 Tax=Niabella beijingensis TaxID=2872700 RepID=UPI001CBA6BDC|nr:phosphoribosylanthranilate isomerase [Niabella beijingensis]MBZ4190271.1 phosphoribosylanthranilate isomerase [Niabella beijingensis]
MTRPLIKVCGMTQLQQVAQLAAMGVDYAGFIFYPPSPRYIGGNIDPAALKRLNGIKKAGVFVNATVEEVLDAVAAYGLDMIQLHGDETPELCSRLKNAAEIVKVFRITGKEDLKQLTSPYTDVADAFLFDTKAKEYGGTGKKFDWSGLQHAEPGVPYFLSGGIGPDDLEELKAFLTANTVHALDVNSKFETAPGIKDIRLLEHFLNRLHG